MIKTIINILILSIFLFVSSCKDDAVEPIDPSSKHLNRVLVSNEGNFQKGNSSLGIYLPDSNMYIDQEFKNQNKIPMGDVLNSIRLIEGSYWCVVNNSGLIHVIDSATLKIKHTITGFASPRQVCEASDSKVYVTDLFSGEVSVVSKSTFKIIGSVKIPGWTEHCLLAGGRVYVTSSDRPYVYLIDPIGDQITDSIKIGNSANSMLRADNATVLILCEGKWGSSELAGVYNIDPKARQLTNTVNFADGEKPKLMRQNPVDNRVYVVNTHLFVLDALDYSVVKKVIDLETSTYAFDIDYQGNFYIGDAQDFVSKSLIRVYDKDNFNLLKSFEAGINTNGFVFE